jgi:sulfatase maturation enzyme AslB (radical SAM superfamily)
MYKDQIKWLHVEASTKCNAWCPSCPRNLGGQGLRPGLIEQDLDPVRFQNILDDFETLDGIQFCGNYGDPVIAGSFTELVKLAVKKTQKIQIHTNGSLRNIAWWKELAELLSGTNHNVWFGIDGLKGVHEIYRQATDFDRVIENAQAFIDAGGTATWQFIPFRHNEHQIKDCMRLSQQLGFKAFKIVKSFRADQAEARHWKTGKVFMLEPADVYQSKWKKSDPNYVDPTDCMHLEQPGIYVSANGGIGPCCYLADQYNFESTDILLKQLNIATILGNTPLKTCLRNCGSYQG